MWVVNQIGIYPKTKNHYLQEKVTIVIRLRRYEWPCKEILHTKIASISLLDKGVLLGWREAFPPSEFEAFELEKNATLASIVEDEAWVSGAEPATNFLKELYT